MINTAKRKANVKRMAQWPPAMNVSGHCAESALLKHDICAWNGVPHSDRSPFSAFWFIFAVCVLLHWFCSIKLLLENIC